MIPLFGKEKEHTVGEQGSGIQETLLGDGIERLIDSNTQIVNPKGEMKGSAITGPVGKEAAELWPVSRSSGWSSGKLGANSTSVLQAIQAW